MDRPASSLAEVKHEIGAMRLQSLSPQTDAGNIFGGAARIDGRLAHIESRLELRDLAEAQGPYEHK